MLYTVAIIGRPNVGKSTLFNALVGDNQRAIVGDLAGLTRDRQYAYADIGDDQCVLIDTPGIGMEDEAIDELCTQQTEFAIHEADLVLWMVDAREGLVMSEKQIAHKIRQHQKPIILLVNKTDGIDERLAFNDFYELGIENMLAMAVSHRHGVNQLRDMIIEACPERSDIETLKSETKEKTTITIIGRPNVGKSTLTNRLLGEERVVACDMPGTTRDSIAIDFEYDDQPYRLVDTAGIRRKARVEKGVEQFSVIQSLRSLDVADFAFVLIDAHEDLVDQDLHLLELVAKAGAAILIVINKWDGLDEDQKKHIKDKLRMKLRFIDYAPIQFISALHGSGVGLLLKEVQKIRAKLYQDYTSTQLTKILEDAVAYYPPPMNKGRRIKLRYAHSGGHKPIKIIIHGNQTQSLSASYKRYLLNQYRKALGDLSAIPIRLIFKTGDNPFQGKRNKLTPRQLRKRRRMMKHVKK